MESIKMLSIFVGCLLLLSLPVNAQNLQFESSINPQSASVTVGASPQSFGANGLISGSQQSGLSSGLSKFFSNLSQSGYPGVQSIGNYASKLMSQLQPSNLVSQSIGNANNGLSTLNNQLCNTANSINSDISRTLNQVNNQQQSAQSGLNTALNSLQQNGQNLASLSLQPLSSIQNPLNGSSTSSVTNNAGDALSSIVDVDRKLMSQAGQGIDQILAQTSDNLSSQGSSGGLSNVFNNLATQGLKTGNGLVGRFFGRR